MNAFRQHRRYLLTVFFLSLLALPAIAQFLMFFVTAGSVVSVVSAVLFVFLLGVFCNSWAGRDDLPDLLFWRYLPIAAAFGWYLLAFVVTFGISGYQFGSDAFIVFSFVTLPWLVLNFILAFAGDYSLFPAAVAVLYALLWLVFVICNRVHKRRGSGRRQALASLGALLLLCGVCGGQFYMRSQRVLTGYYSDLRVEDEVDLWVYRPFQPGNLLKKTATPPNLVIESDYPRLDGATAAYPVYGAMAQAIYQGLDEDSVGEYVDCTTTPTAYERLINGEIDIFFGAQPSQQQIDLAAAQGVEFRLTPIAKEAFVFFVNSENPVGELSVEQIQDIYQKKITNWQQVGGADEAILPFQRPQNSGSQTIMQRVMGGKRLPAPLMEEYAEGMGGIISGVAAYRNYTGAIGYSFRYFATGMKPNEGIRLLAVGGIAPTVENIRSGQYPFTVDVYAVTTKEPAGNVALLLDWALSQQGQALIEQCGYVAMPPLA